MKRGDARSFGYQVCGCFFSVFGMMLVVAALGLLWLAEALHPMHYAGAGPGSPEQAAAIETARRTNVLIWLGVVGVAVGITIGGVLLFRRGWRARCHE